MLRTKRHANGATTRTEYPDVRQLAPRWLAKQVRSDCVHTRCIVRSGWHAGLGRTLYVAAAAGWEVWWHNR